MESTRVNHSDLVGKLQRKTAVLEAIVQANDLNRTGEQEIAQYSCTVLDK